MDYTSVMFRALLLVVTLAACSSQSTPPAEPASEPAPAEAPPAPAAGKRAPCTFGADQTCNEDPKVSSLWGKCTEQGVCVCNEGFELSPGGYCRPAS